MIRRTQFHGHTSGFTLLEMLIVLAVLGIILALGVGSVIGWIRSTQLREAATQVEADLERVRSGSLRFNRDAQFQVLSATSYQLTVDGRDSVVTLPNATLGPVGTTVTYSAPHSLLGSAPQPLQISVGPKSRTIRTIGLTGKVVIDASN